MSKRWLALDRSRRCEQSHRLKGASLQIDARRGVPLNEETVPAESAQPSEQTMAYYWRKAFRSSRLLLLIAAL